MSALNLSPTRQRGGLFPPALARRTFPGLLLSGAVLATFAGRATAQNQNPDDARRIQEIIALRQAQDAARLQAELARLQVLGGAGAAQQVWPDEQLEAWVFSQYGGAAGARRQLEAQLTRLVSDIDRTCKLTVEQRNKIRLTGRGDIKRLFDAFEKVKERFRSVNNNAGRLQEILPEITPLQHVLQTGLFHDDSLVLKSMRRTLTHDQFERYDAVVRERRASQHRAIAQQAVAMIERGAPLNFAGRRDLTTVVAGETKPSRKPSQYDVYVIFYQIGRLPDEKLRPLLDDVQWRNLKRLVEQSQSLEPTLRQQGLMPD